MLKSDETSTHNCKDGNFGEADLLGQTQKHLAIYEWIMPPVPYTPGELEWAELSGKYIYVDGQEVTD